MVHVLDFELEIWNLHYLLNRHQKQLFILTGFLTTLTTTLFAHDLNMIYSATCSINTKQHVCPRHGCASCNVYMLHVCVHTVDFDIPTRLRKMAIAQAEKPGAKKEVKTKRAGN